MAQAQGSKGIVSIQYEESFGVSAAAPNMTKVYFDSEGFKASRNLVASTIITGSRNSAIPLLGNIDVQGSLFTELGSNLGMLLHGACGTVKSTLLAGTETLSSPGGALTGATGVVSGNTLVLTLASGTAHGYVVGDMVTLGATSGVGSSGDLAAYRFPVIAVGVWATGSGTVTLRFGAGFTGAVTVVFGNIKKVVPNAAPTYTHEFKSGGILPSFAVEKGFTDLPQYFTYNGCRVGKMSLNVAMEGAQKLSFDFTGKKETLATTPVDTTITDLLKKSFVGGDLLAAGIMVGGSVLATITKCDISLDNSLDTSIYCLGGGGTRAEITSGSVKVTGTVECLFDSITLYNIAVAGTESSIKLQFKKGLGDGTVDNEFLEVLIPELMFKQETPKISGDKGIMVTLAFESYASDFTTQLQITLKNSQLAI